MIIFDIFPFLLMAVLVAVLGFVVMAGMSLPLLIFLAALRALRPDRSQEQEPAQAGHPSTHHPS